MPLAYCLIHKDHSGAFGISFPDFPGCVSGGETVDAALRSGHDALAFHVAGMIEDGEALPQLRDLDALMADPELRAEFDGATVALVSVDLPAKAVRINVSMDETLLDRVDRAASASGQTRSAYIAEAVRRRMVG